MRSLDQNGTLFFMRKLFFYLIVALIFNRPLYAQLPQEGKWNDALSAIEPSSLETSGLALGDIDFSVSNSSLPESQITAHDILVRHLIQIREAGLLSNTVAEESYWQEVFEKAGHPELFESGKDEISVAVKAGLEPYLKGEELTAAEFSDRALKAIQKSAEAFSPIASAPEIVVTVTP
jgi:hypothetical protein